ncbi:MAG: 5,10-methylenetetrahydromethanopterin reductase [Haloarculaceae archaeon]
MKGIELTPEHPVDRIADLGRAAEASGFDTVFASCHYNNRDPFLTLDRVAMATETVRLGPGVANPFETHPATLASRLATLDEVSDGRAVFGVGAGDASTLRNLGYDPERPLRRVLESFTVARDLWAGERVDHDGAFRAHDAGLNYEAGEIPVYVGAQGPQMLGMAAKHADGVLFNGSHPDDAAWAADRIEEGLRERPDERGAFDFAVYASVSVAPTTEAAREAARPPVAFIASGAAPPVLDRHDLDADRASAIGEAISAGEFQAAFDHVTEPMLDAFCIAGTPAEVAEGVASVLDYADSVVAGAPLGPDLDRAVTLAGESLDRAIRA